MKKMKIPDWKIEPMVYRETKRILKYPNGIYLLTVGKVIPEHWKKEPELIVDVDVLEFTDDYVILKITKRETFLGVR